MYCKISIFITSLINHILYLILRVHVLVYFWFQVPLYDMNITLLFDFGLGISPCVYRLGRIPFTQLIPWIEFKNNSMIFYDTHMYHVHVPVHVF